MTSGEVRHWKRTGAACLNFNRFPAVSKATGLSFLDAKRACMALMNSGVADNLHYALDFSNYKSLMRFCCFIYTFCFSMKIKTIDGCGF